MFFTHRLKHNNALQTRSTLTRFSPYAALLGGASWILYYTLILSFGLEFDGAMLLYDMLASSSYRIVCEVCFYLALLFLGCALIGFTLRVHSRFAYAGSVLAFVTVCLAIWGLVQRSNLLAQLIGAFEKSGLTGGVGVMSLCVATSLTGVAWLKTTHLSRVTGYLLLTVGVLTFPLIITIHQFMPDVPLFIADELPFAVAGALWLFIAAHDLHTHP